MKQTSQDNTSLINHASFDKPYLVTFSKTRSIPALIISASQIIAARTCRLLLLANGGFTIKSSITVNPNTRYLFVANHQSELDPFSVFAVMPIRSNFDAAPVRFLTAKTVYYSPIMFFLKSMGCYPTRGHREQIVAESVKYLYEGYNVFIFPEGKRTLESTSEPRPGVSDIIKKAPQSTDVKMILVHIEWERMQFGRRHVTISMKQAEDALYQKDACEIMKALYKV